MTGRLLGFEAREFQAPGTSMARLAFMCHIEPNVAEGKNSGTK